MVSGLTIVFTIVSAIFAVAFPVVLCIFYKTRYKSSLLAFFTGCAVWVVFAAVLEQFVHKAVLSGSLSDKIIGSPLIYAIYGGLCAGVFEEVGRYIAMKTVLKKKHSNKYNALMYGAGHGGIECILILGTSMLNNIIYAIMINLGQSEMLMAACPEAQKDTLKSVLDSLIEAPSSYFLLGGMERFSAVMLHIALSVFVWKAVVNKKVVFFPLAILIHAVFDAITVYLNQATEIPPFLLEFVIMIMAFATAYASYKVFKLKTETNENSWT